MPLQVVINTLEMTQESLSALISTKMLPEHPNISPVSDTKFVLNLLETNARLTFPSEDWMTLALVEAQPLQKKDVRKQCVEWTAPICLQQQHREWRWTSSAFLEVSQMLPE